MCLLLFRNKWYEIKEVSLVNQVKSTFLQELSIALNLFKQNPCMQKSSSILYTVHSLSPWKCHTLLPIPIIMPLKSLCNVPLSNLLAFQPLLTISILDRLNMGLKNTPLEPQLFPASITKQLPRRNF